MKRTMLFFVLMIALAVVPVMAMQEHGSHDGGMAMTSDKPMDKDAADPSMGHAGMGGTYKHMATEGGVEATFQVMRLDSMNMTSDKGETHHIMVDLKSAGGGSAITDAVGKIKVIAPDKSEQVSPLKNYNGILAGNFTFTEPGNYGVICMTKTDAGTQVFKFWYPHQ